MTKNVKIEPRSELKGRYFGIPRINFTLKLEKN